MFHAVEEPLWFFRRPTSRDLPLGGLSAIASPSRISSSLGVGPARRFHSTPRISRLMFPTASADARRFTLLHVSDPCLAAGLPSMAPLHIIIHIMVLKAFDSAPARGDTICPHTASAYTLTESLPGQMSRQPRCPIPSWSVVVVGDVHPPAVRMGGSASSLWPKLF